MLPLTSPFDSYRAGIWVLGENLRTVLFIGCCLTALYAADITIFERLNSPWLTVVFATIFILVMIALHGGLLVCFLATFLTRPGQSARVLIDPRRFFRVTLRLLAITSLEALPIVLVVCVMFAFEDMDAFTSGNGILLTTFAFIASGLVATIILGTRIPQIVKHPDRRDLPPSVTIMACVRKMLLPLVCGPAAVLGLAFVVAYMLNALVLEMTLVDYVFFGVQTMMEILAAAMTAAILSDTYLEFETDG